MIRHFTSTALVFFKDHVLLHHRQKLDKWMPPGGHIEENELPTDAAIRETKEEAGIDIDLISFNPAPLIKTPNASSLISPYHCLLENVPAHKDTPFHQHIDLIYLAAPSFEQSLSPGFYWMNMDQVNALMQEAKLFQDTFYLIQQGFVDILLPVETYPRNLN